MNIELVVSAFAVSFSLLLKDVFKNLFAGVWLFISPEFRKDDYVVLEDGKEGVIKNFSMRNIHIKLNDGSVLIKESSSFLDMDIIRKRNVRKD